jgi:ATP-dependent Clp protease ATP-binding subunit ClpB
MDELSKLRAELEEKRWDMERMQSKYNLHGAAELKYDVIPALEARIAALSTMQKHSDDDAATLLPHVMGPEQIAVVVSKWTGIPSTYGHTDNITTSQHHNRHMSLCCVCVCQ